MIHLHIKKENRKKILLLSDDARLNSGVGTVSRKIIKETAHIYNWVQIGAAIKNPDTGKILDVSIDINKIANIDDASVKIYPCDGYGNPPMLRQIIRMENPDAILHYTDPRFWQWLYNMEHELRQTLPIFYYNIWDNLPYPMYNKSSYLSSNLIMNISKQTYNIVKNVIGESNYIDIHDVKDKTDKIIISYIPHGIDPDEFYPINKDDCKMIDINNEFKSEADLMVEFKKEIVGSNKYDFIIFFNNRNIRRKMVSSVIESYNLFCESLLPEESKRCLLLLHTQPIDNNGTDLFAVVDALCKYPVIFSDKKLESNKLNYMYNFSDITINIANAEGFGLSTAESIMASTPILINVTGGLQDQAGFIKEDNTYLTEKDFTTEWGSNHDGRYKEHGKWAYIVFPASTILVGSPPTPYIYDDYISIDDVVSILKEIYKDKSKLKEYGLLGREFMLKENIALSSPVMGNLFIEHMNIGMESFIPRERFTLQKI